MRSFSRAFTARAKARYCSHLYWREYFELIKNLRNNYINVLAHSLENLGKH